MMFKLKQEGFTLVEMMVVIAIIGITATFAASSYRVWIQNTKVRTAAESILNGIQKARSEALMRNTPVQFTLGVNSGWTVQCVTAALCSDLAGGVVEVRNNNEGGTSAVNVNAGAGTNVMFTNLGLVSTIAPNQITQVDVTLTDADHSLRIKIGAGGNVRLCDPAASASDPRNCLI